ncbi:hypothetical protein [Natronomonas gomsonensis]|uniref:DUF7537 family lipoprotein n=1 Tax=Natronomonas gomsonensis TaxID=1046043 RepID=UPI0015BC2D68|nr:hypothetical protein [Natronomonas gomsonensis]
MRALLVALLVVLAGCSGLPVGQPAESTETVTPVPERSLAPSYPPGVTDRGVEAPDATASAHVDRLAETSYTLTSNRTVRTNGTLDSFFSVRVDLDDERNYHAKARTDGPDGPEFLGRPPATAEFWSGEETHIRKLTRDGETTYDEIESGPGRVSTWRYWTRTAPFGDRQGSVFRTVRDVVGSFTWRVDSEGTGDMTQYRLEADEYASTAFAPSEVTAVRNASASATVSQSGLVRSIHMRYVGTIDGETVVVERTIRWENVGNTSVERPPWYDRALE